MRGVPIKDRVDWRGCEVVQFDPEKLGGRATVHATRMDADGVLINSENGMTPEEIEEHFGVNPQDTHTLLAFAAAQRLKASA